MSRIGAGAPSEASSPHANRSAWSRLRAATTFLVLAHSLCFGVASSTAETEESSPVEAEPAQSEPGELEPWEENPHLLTLLALGTHEYEESVTAATFGVDYEYRFTRLFGAGIVAEYAIPDIREATILAVADLHVWRNLVIQVGPGIAIVDEEDEPTETEFAFRGGLIWEIEIGRLAITPQVHYDYTTGKDAIVFGTGFGWRF